MPRRLSKPPNSPPRKFRCTSASSILDARSASLAETSSHFIGVFIMDFPEGTFTIGGDLKVRRLGFGAMRLTGRGIWGPPKSEDEAIRVLRRAIELGVNLIDTADS